MSSLWRRSYVFLAGWEAYAQRFDKPRFSAGFYLMTIFLMVTNPRYPRLTRAHHCFCRRDAIRDSAEDQPASKGVPELSMSMTSGA